MGKILLYYKYVNIEYPKQMLKWQQKICADLSLTGRILIGHEGINGTVGGDSENIELYKTIMNKQPLFAGIDFKESAGDASCFPRLQIKIRPEIVRMGIDPEIVTAKDGGIHLTPQQAHTLLDQRPDDLVILDGRNKYESDIGMFEGAITPNTRYFREFPAYIDANLDQFKDKQVLMYCTGGIRCERASAYLKLKGVAKEVYQVEGGIARYVEAYPDGHFKGKNYVFDARIATKANDTLLGKCALCAHGCDSYTNCLNALCNKHFIVCEPCKIVLKGTCSKTCSELVQNNQVTIRPELQTISAD